MKVNLVGHGYRHPSDFRIHRPQGSGDCLLLVVRSSAVFFLDEKPVHTPAGTVLILETDQPQIYGGDGEEFVNDWVHFTPDATVENLPWQTPIIWGDVRELSELIVRIQDAYYSMSHYRESIMNHYLSVLLLKIAEYGQTGHQNELSGLRAQIYNDPARKWTVPMLAHKAARSLSYFQHIYRQTFGVSVMEDVIRARMEYAKYLLAGSRDTVAEIANACGYENDVHFMRQFKARTQQTPTQWRKEHD